jgi:hypothetical protein
MPPLPEVPREIEVGTAEMTEAMLEALAI